MSYVMARLGIYFFGLQRELAILKLRFGTDDAEGTKEAEGATYADLTDFVFEKPVSPLSDASWTGQVYNRLHTQCTHTLDVLSNFSHTPILTFAVSSYCHAYSCWTLTR